MALYRKIEMSADVALQQSVTRTLLERSFPDCSVSNFGAMNKIRSDFQWGLLVRKTWRIAVTVSLIQKKTFTGQDKGPPHLQVAKHSPMLFGPLLLVFLDDAFLDSVAAYLEGGFIEDIRRQTA